VEGSRTFHASAEVYLSGYSPVVSMSSSAGPFVEAADQHQEVVARRVDASGQLDDGAVEVVDGAIAVAFIKTLGIVKGDGRHHGTYLYR
jgi:hypothetical protein